LSNMSSLSILDLTINTDLVCWETEEALNWALSIEYCTKGASCIPGYSGPTDACQP